MDPGLHARRYDGVWLIVNGSRQGAGDLEWYLRRGVPPPPPPAPAPRPFFPFGLSANLPRDPPPRQPPSAPVAKPEDSRPRVEDLLPPWPPHDKQIQSEWLALKKNTQQRMDAGRRREEAEWICAEVREHEREREERRQEQDREASRPYYQFLAQVTLERERILVELNSPKPAPKHPFNRTWYGITPLDYAAEVAQWEKEMAERKAAAETTVPYPTDVNTTAYERAKAAWTDWHIWNSKWGVLPGMTWQHELTLDEFIHAELGDEPADDYEYECDIAAREGLADFVAQLRNFDSMKPSPTHSSPSLDPSARPSPEEGAVPPKLPPTVDDHGTSAEEATTADRPGTIPVPAKEAARPLTPPISRENPLRKGKQKAGAGPTALRGQQRAPRAPTEDPDRSEIERSALGPVSPSRVSKIYATPQPAPRGRHAATDILQPEEPDAPAQAASPLRKSKRLLEVGEKRETEIEAPAAKKSKGASRAGVGTSRTAEPEGVGYQLPRKRDTGAG